LAVRLRALVGIVVSVVAPGCGSSGSGGPPASADDDSLDATLDGGADGPGDVGDTSTETAADAVSPVDAVADTALPLDAAPIPQADFCTTPAAKMCTGFASCCGASGFTANEAACETNFKTACAAEVSQVAAAGYSYDGSVAAACYGGLGAELNTCAVSVPANERSAINTTCSRVFHGTVAIGGMCKTSSDCAPVAGGGLVVCVGFTSNATCVPAGTGVTGDPCGGVLGARVSCAAGYYFNYGSSNATCAPRGGEGAACGSTRLGGLCRRPLPRLDARLHEGGRPWSRLRPGLRQDVRHAERMRLDLEVLRARGRDRAALRRDAVRVRVGRVLRHRRREVRGAQDQRHDLRVGP
jgi:hypothetical protein